MQEIKYIEPAALRKEMTRLAKRTENGFPRKPHRYGLGRAY